MLLTAGITSFPSLTDSFTGLVQQVQHGTEIEIFVYETINIQGNYFQLTSCFF
jgi:hypothetical protein